MDLSDRSYMQLNGDERFRALISAAARCDGNEMDRLVDTCPEKHYRMLDADFKAPLDKFMLLAASHNAVILRMVVGFLLAVSLRHSSIESDAQDSSGGIDRLEDASMGAMLAKMRAWDAFCRDIGIDTAEAAAAFGFRDDTAEAFALSAMMAVADEWQSETEPQETFARIEAAYLEELRETWARANRIRGAH
jgi:hypothetical protein